MNKKWLDFDEAFKLVKSGGNVFRADGKRVLASGVCLGGGHARCDAEMASDWGVRFYTLTNEAVEITIGEAFERMSRGEEVESDFGGCFGPCRFDYSQDRPRLQWKAYTGAWIEPICHDISSRKWRLPAIEETETITITVPKGAKITVDGAPLTERSSGKEVSNG